MQRVIWMIATLLKIVNAAYLATVLILGAVIIVVPHQASYQAPIGQVEALDKRVERLENTASKVDVSIAVIDERTKIDHEILLGIALAVIGMGLETAWRTMKFGGAPNAEHALRKQHKEKETSKES